MKTLNSSKILFLDFNSDLSGSALFDDHPLLTWLYFSYVKRFNVCYILNVKSYLKLFYQVANITGWQLGHPDIPWVRSLLQSEILSVANQEYSISSPSSAVTRNTDAQIMWTQLWSVTELVAKEASEFKALTCFVSTNYKSKAINICVWL